MSIRKIFGSAIFSVALAAGLFFGGFVKAGLDVEFPVGSNFHSGVLFDDGNIIPGWSTTKTIRIENDESFDIDVYLRIKVSGDKKLAEALKLYVIRIDDGSFRVGGEGDRYDLKSANKEDLFIDRLRAGKGKNYRIKIKFDEKAGDEYQGLILESFEIEFGSEEADEEKSEEEILVGQERVVTGDSPEEEADDFQNEGEEVEVFGETDSGGQVKASGVARACSSWPWWVWLIILAVYLDVFYKITFNEKTRSQKKMPWKAQILALVVVLVFWWYFDACKNYLWFICLSVVISLLEVGLFWKRFIKDR